jgi:hypothetical protein
MNNGHAWLFWKQGVANGKQVAWLASTRNKEHQVMNRGMVGFYWKQGVESYEQVAWLAFTGNKE